MSSERLIYMPLGGAGEIGMNAYVYGYGAPDKERLILVDLGVTFPDMDGSPGVDLILPDITWLKDRADRLDAIFITHAHEDHVGAVAHFYRDLGAPVYARAFTANIARRKMAEHGHPESAVRTAAPWPATITAGPFTVGFVPISHSIPESSGLVIDSPGGRIVHTGDFKIDHDPVVGEPFDRDLWASLAEPGVKALVCDSTNVFSHHEGRSESTVGKPITELVERVFELWEMNIPEDTYITYVPMEKKKEKKRGFNQAELIAEELGKILGKKVVPLLRKVRETRSQTELNEEERLINVKNAFSAISKVLPDNVLLVDDIWTTGATMKECSKVLKKAGVKNIFGFTLARTI